VAKKEVAKAQSKEIVESRPSYISRNDRGSENVTTNDITIPRLSIIQSLSPQQKRNDAEYIPGAEAGMVFNSVTKKLYDGEAGLTIIPVYFKPEWVIWRDRKKGGGFISSHETAAEANQALRDHPDAKDLEILDTAQHFCLLVEEDGTLSEVVISMSKSQMRVSRQLNSMVRLTNGEDRFARSYTFATVLVEGEQGDYYNWKVEQNGYVEEKSYRRAESVYESIAAGRRAIHRDDTADVA
jgi:hypothetical protein